ncbi:cellobiose phosphorylase [Caloramator sp. CAR-1]|uniref:cellobiose phosphorylase n=1 Tax=Caloramator sp. CAR-1 TaxID=3062777 RepID=UPI0026E2470A|nr:cellobiose phosphorylase [Caloramator sp. CAR-1]MDO6356055.1 cellobiose phosphorylase [Caloramator sp. CAR-1]
MSKFYFDEKNRFVIENFNASKPFASFLPGIAGKKGIPMWIFYVNRGQCISSFGIKNKDNPIMEFFPAYKCYQNVQSVGFRTFIKFTDEQNIYEPFLYPRNNKVNQKMYIGMNELEIEEVNTENGLQINVLYFMLPQEKIAALVRKVTIKNISNNKKSLEILDGMPVVLPYGISDGGLKQVGNTLKAWMEVYNHEGGIPIFRMRSSSEDSVNVTEFKEGNFYLSFKNVKGKKDLINPIVDIDLVFGMNTSLSYPDVFYNFPLSEILDRKQITSNKIPCSFSAVSLDVNAGEALDIYTIIGHAPEISVLESYKEIFMDENYINNKYLEGKKIVERLTDDIYTKTSSKLFDEYCRQSYLDNILRGGYPLILKNGDKPLVYYMYSRKHGDLERDYNYFSLEPEYYSSGNGNYRDINQNRRNDVFFNPEVKSYNIKIFMNLIQADGYNPLVINGVKYRIKANSLDFIDELAEDTDKLKEILSNPFTPGRLITFIEQRNIKLKVSQEEFLTKIMENAEEEIDAVHGEGFWTDHWTYNLDLIENYLEVYPDKKRDLLFNEYDYTYFDNSKVVLPREKRYVLSNGKVRQYNSIVEDKDKKKLIESRKTYKNIMRANKGVGEIYTTNLIVKLLNLAAVKFATIDPAGMGIEMEAGKPGWYDALNGLPGLFGSSVAEAFELVRLFNFILDVLKEYPDEEIKIPIEVMQLIENEVKYVQRYNESNMDNKDYDFWSIMSDLREKYREDVKFGFQGKEVSVRSAELIDKIKELKDKLQLGLDKAIINNDGLMPTYFYYDVEEYEIIKGIDKDVDDENQEQYIRALKFKQNKMPLFLEGIVRGFKIYNDKDFLSNVYKRVKNSDLFDKKLKMYKVNASLNKETIEIGRARAFTPGWLENESIWLHMEYKYMLELLKSGLYKEYYDDFKNVLIPFMDASVYGRSPLENSSFIASSANVDESIHGTGFVARLSGATAEFLSMWRLMFVGKKPFKIINGKLTLSFNPVLPEWLFDEENKVSFNFLGRCRVTYYNPSRKNTYEMDITKQKIIIYLPSGNTIEFLDNFIEEEYATLIREGKINRIDIYLK